MANRNSKRKAKALGKQLTLRKQTNPNYKCYPPPPKRRSRWRGCKGVDRNRLRKGAVSYGGNGNE